MKQNVIVCPLQEIRDYYGNLNNFITVILSIIHVIILQGAKKIIFTAYHSGKLKLEFTSPDIISTSPKGLLMSRIDFTVLPLFKLLKKTSLARWAT